MVTPGTAEQVAHGEPGVAGADDDGVNGSHGGSFRWVGPAGEAGRPGGATGGQPVTTSMWTGVGLVSAS